MSPRRQTLIGAAQSTTVEPGPIRETVPQQVHPAVTPLTPQRTKLCEHESVTDGFCTNAIVMIHDS